MAGITHRVSTSSFKPLSLDEIMMVPLAKRKMEDDFLANTDKINQLEASTLAGDSEEAQATLGGMKERAGALSDEILKKGFSRGQMNRLRGLRGDVTKEYGSQGFLGNAIANKKAFAAYSQNLLKNKDNRGGYSAAEAQQWAGSQLQGFKTKNDDGSFNSFSGSQMAEKVDEDKFMKDVVASVAEKVTPVTASLLKNSPLPFQYIMQSGKINSKDYKTIMRAMLSSAQTSPDLINHLRQQAFFTKEENPFDLGKFDYKTVPVKDSAGNPVLDSKGNVKTKTVENFTPGKSRFGRKMAGYSQAASYVNPDISEKILKDDVAMKMHQKGMDDQSAAQTVAFVQGEYNALTVDNFETLQEDLDLFSGELEIMRNDLNKLPKDSEEYKKLNESYQEKKIEYINSRNRINYINKEIYSQINPTDKKIYEIQDVLSKHNGDPEEALKKEWNTTIDLEETNNPGIGIVKEDNAEYGLKKGQRVARRALSLHLLSSKYGHKVGYSEYGNSIGDYDEYGGEIKSATTLSDWDEQLKDADSRKSDLAKKYIEANPQSEYFTRFNGSYEGKYSTELGAYNKMRSDNFSVVSANVAYGGGMLQDHPDYAEIIAATPQGEVPKFKVEITDGRDTDGMPFNNVVMTTSAGEASFQVVDNLNQDILVKFGRMLQGGSPSQVKMGNQLVADSSHMSNIKKSKLRYSNSGKIPFTAGGRRRTDVDYIKNDNGTYTVTIGGKPIDHNGRVMLEGEKEISLALYKAQQQIDLAKANYDKKNKPK